LTPKRVRHVDPVGAVVSIVTTLVVINGRFGPRFVVCDKPCWGEHSSLIPCYQRAVIDVMERHRLRRHVGGVDDAWSFGVVAGAAGRVG
jgi:hypothetical protein